MALRALILRNKLDAKKKQLEELRKRDPDFEKREKELSDAIGEMTEETSEEDRKTVEGKVEQFQQEKDGHDKSKSDLEAEISDIEKEIEEEERKVPAPEKPEERGMKVGHTMENRTKFFGMSIQERDAFFMREDVSGFLSEVRTCIKEKRAITNVGLTIPDVMLPLLKEVAQNTSKLIKYVNLKPVKGKARQNVMGTIPEGIWTEMIAKLNELELVFNNVEVDGYKVGGFFAVANSILEDNDVNLATELITAIGKSIGKAVDKAIVYGTGTKMPLGFVTRLAQATKPSDYSSTAREWKALNTSNIVKMTVKTGTALFKDIVTNSSVADSKDYSDASLVWIMNKKTHNKLLAESIGANMNAAIVAGMNSAMPIVGGTIEELDFMSDDDIAFGYLDLYLLAERSGTVLAQSEHVRFLEDQTVFKGTARYDGTPVIAEAFGILNINNTAPATTKTFAADAANTPAENGAV